MTAGRCAGCGKEDASCKLMLNHVASCPEYARLFREDPSRALSPEAEYLRYREEDAASDSAAARDARLEKRFAQLDAQRERQADRWTTPPDILDDL